MAGHNKWSSIKHKKAKTDAQKGKQFSKVGREIMMAVKLGGSDEQFNPRLRLALQKAKEVNMPNQNIDRAIKKGEGGQDLDKFEEVTFEAYGPNGVAILIETLTDNRNRTVPNLRAALTRANGSLATKGAVAYLFESKGFILFDSHHSQDTILDVASECDIDDLDVKEDGSVEIITPSSALESVKQVFDEQNIDYVTAQIQKLASTSIQLSADDAQSVIQLLETLEDDDDVQEVHANLEII